MGGEATNDLGGPFISKLVNAISLVLIRVFKSNWKVINHQILLLHWSKAQYA